MNERDDFRKQLESVSDGQRVRINCCLLGPSNPGDPYRLCVRISYSVEGDFGGLIIAGETEYVVLRGASSPMIAVNKVQGATIPEMQVPLGNVVGFDRLATTRDEFERQYAENSGLTVEALHSWGRYVEPCSCGDESCPGWAMGHQWEDALVEDEWHSPRARPAVLEET